MKYLKLYEEINSTPTFNTGDIVKVILDEYKSIYYDSNLYKVVNYEAKKISLPIPTNEIYELDLIYGELNRNVNPFWIRGYQLRLATDDEINEYLIKKDANKYNL